MGQREHYWCSWQLGIWENIFGNGYRGVFELAMGCHPVYGSYQPRTVGHVLQSAKDHCM